ncbi:MAG: 2-phospho-L-lactate transferase [Burkholderiales bacterium]
MIVALAGGVGGAKLAAGLAQELPSAGLTVVVNTGDDFEHLGLHVSPDLDTVMYTLAGVANPQTGWGVANETCTFMEALDRLGGPTWFRLGDRDLATHVERTRRLRAGESLSTVTRSLCERLGVRHTVLPMCDDPVRTLVDTEEGVLEFQHYFVRERCRPRLRSLEYRGASEARASPELLRALELPALDGIILCPSNPYLSIAPILAIPGMREALERAKPVLAVSPIVGGQALKGPAAKIMQELGVAPSALEVSRYYAGLVDAMLIDWKDAPLCGAIEALGMRAIATDIVMRTDADRARLAGECIALLRKMRAR